MTERAEAPGTHRMAVELSGPGSLREPALGRCPSPRAAADGLLRSMHAQNGSNVTHRSGPSSAVGQRRSPKERLMSRTNVLDGFGPRLNARR